MRYLLSVSGFVLFAGYFAEAQIAPYCNNPSMYGDGGYDIGVTNVTLGGINNNSTAPAGSGGYGWCQGGWSFGVTDYTNTGTYGTANLTQNSSYSISIKVGDYTAPASQCPSTDANGAEAWIDWDADGFFTYPGEYIGFVLDLDAAETGTINFTVPCNATPGNTRMRVYSDDDYVIGTNLQANYGGMNNDACNNYWGEFEDYTVNIVSAGAIPMVYNSSDVTQNVTIAVAQGSTSQEVIGIKIVTCGSLSPLVADTFYLSTAGTSNPANDIQNAKIWYTGTSGTFATTTQFGTTVAAPNGAFKIGGTQTLSSGTNFFWLTYDVKAGATLNNYIDAQCTTIRVSGSNKTPTTTSPAGSRMVDGNMVFTSTTTTQSNTSPVSKNSTNNQVIGVQVVTSGSANPLSAKAFVFNTTGTTAPATDITNAKLWYTGTSGAFATTTQLGSTVASPNGIFTINGFSQALSSGTNYFWLSYDIPSGATTNNVIDAQCTSDTIGTTGYVPSTTNPAGTRTINPPPGTYYVINTADAGAGSYRQAVKDANNDGINPSYIYFNIPGGGVQTINLTSNFNGGANPSEYIITPMIIDATTQPGYAGSPLVEINGNGLSWPFPFYVRAGWGASFPPNTNSSGTTIKGICVNRVNGGSGIIIEMVNNCIVENCYIGTDPTGTIARANAQSGISFSGDNHIIRNNLISGNTQHGISGGGNNALITGNKVGTNAAGTAAVGNSNSGIYITSATGCTVGGTTGATRNIISGNVGVGVSLGSGILVIGNYIGTDVNGTSAVPNGSGAVLAANNAILGGTGAGEGNVISGNTGYGVASGMYNSGLVIGNYIGVNTTGNVALGNGQDGVYLSGIWTTGNTIGGTSAGARNIISGNGRNGVWFGDWAASNKIWGNYIGVGANGTTAIGNANDGIGMYYQDSATAVTNSNQIGGMSTAKGNIIANNGGYGIDNVGSRFNLYGRNLIYNNALSKGINHIDPTPSTSPAGHGNCYKTPPVISSANSSTVVGTATAGDTVEVFCSSGTTDANCKQAEIYLGSVLADGSGNWSLAVSLSGQVVKATARENVNNNTSEFSACLTAVLPVEMYSFTAHASGEKVLVEWETTSETDNDHFIIERSQDASDWEALAQVKGAGTKTSFTEYVFTDEAPFPGVSYYRLRQVDFDGMYSYFGPAAVTLERTGFEFNVYPNPSDGNTIYLGFNGIPDTKKEILVVVYNARGEEMYSKVVISERSKKILIGTDHLSHLPAGVYMVMASSDNQIFRQKLILR